MARGKSRQTQAPSDLSAQEKRELWAWSQAKYPWMTREQVRLAVSETLEYHQAKGSLWADWKLVCMRRIREQVEQGKIREPSPLDSPGKLRERLAMAERRKQIREAADELRKLTPIELEVLLAEGRERRGF